MLVTCRRDVTRLDDVQQMAYRVKPAVVRINAYATAEFRYDASAIAAVEKQLLIEGHDLIVRNEPEGEAVVETGAGGSGSGFIIHPDGTILTSGHVVSPTSDKVALERELRRNGAIAALVKHFPIEELRAIYRGDGLDRYIRICGDAGRVVNIDVVGDVELSNGEKIPYRIRRYSPSLAERGTDVAILQIDRKNLPSLPLGDSDAVGVGESIWSVGYPAVASSSDDVIGGWLSRDSDLEPTFNPGIITAIKRDSSNRPVFQSNVAIYRGNSGGPAVNARGEVIGISTWGHANAEQIKFLVPIGVAKEMLAEAKVTPSDEGPFNVAYQAALDAANHGEWVEAKKNLLRAAGIFPNSPDVIRFKRDTDRALKDLPLWRLHPVASAIAVGIVVSMIAFAIILIVRGGRPRIPRDILKATTETVVSPGGAPPGQLILGKFTILNGTRAGEKLGLGGSGIRIGRESAICEI
ncbi:MAG TPA: trypsin-like peptidase domain-containing protein, partial [Thermoanaerobaculia bacterium]|nr:trypsin-like peptidase domain-containing protein [Thermoanaerobaculia bacterium]